MEQISNRNEELELLKERADKLGIQYSSKIGIETLRAKVNAKLEEQTIKDEKQLSKAELREKIKKEQLKLVRIRLTCLNPMKKTWRGEILTVANSVIGTVKKFVPFEPKFYTNGYHVPYCIYKLLEDKTFLNIVTSEKNGRITVTPQIAKEFSITVLPQLTTDELEELARAQQAGNRID